VSKTPLRPTIDPLPGLIRQIAVPAGTGMLFHTFFNVVDTWYAGLISTEALAALAVSFPIFFLIIALVVGLGHGASALVAHAIGEDEPERACRLWGQALLLAAFTGLIVALYGLFAAEPLFLLIGAKGESLVLAKSYLVPILLFAFVFLLNAVCNGLLSATGDTRSYRNALIAGAALNVALNPLFMFGIGPLPGLGISGIAVSTILIQMIEFGYLWHRCRNNMLGARFSSADLAPDVEIMGALLRQAVPVTGQMLATAFGLFAITYFMGRHGEAAVAAYGTALRIEQIAMLPMIGLSTAALTLVGQNGGAGQWARVVAASWKAIGYGVALMTVGALLVWLARAELMALFTGDEAVIRLGAAYLGVAILNFNAYAALMIGASILQGLKRPVSAMVIGLFRHILGPLVVLSLLDPILGFGLAGLYWGIFIVSWLGALTTLLYVRYRLNGLGTEAADDRAAASTSITRSERRVS
jgi:putative MATE family efflux protein